MQYGLQRMRSHWGKDHVDVIRHHAPGHQAIALPLKVADGVGDGLCDSWVAHTALARSIVQATLCLFEDGAQFVEACRVRGRARTGLTCVFDCLALPAKLKDQFA